MRASAAGEGITQPTLTCAAHPWQCSKHPAPVEEVPVPGAALSSLQPKAFPDPMPPVALLRALHTSAASAHPSQPERLPGAVCEVVGAAGRREQVPEPGGSGSTRGAALPPSLTQGAMSARRCLPAAHSAPRLPAPPGSSATERRAPSARQPPAPPAPARLSCAAEEGSGLGAAAGSARSTQRGPIHHGRHLE